MPPSSCANVASGNTLVKFGEEPHEGAMSPIVAAASPSVRGELIQLARDARFEVQSVAEDPTSLAQLLAARPSAWVVTGGPLSLARPFLSKARIARVAAVAVLSERTDPRDRAELDYGRLAAIRAIPRVDAFHAAATASRAGFSVWDPDLNASSEITSPSTAASPLSPRERTVLELAGSGLSTKTVARQLGISPNTVKFHLRSAFEKLNVNSRAEAVMAAIRRGELSV